MNNRTHAKRSQARTAIIAEPDVVVESHSDLDLLQKKASIQADQQSLQQSVLIFEKIKTNPAYKKLPYVEDQFSAIEALLKIEKAALKELTDLAASRYRHSTDQEYFFQNRYHDKLNKCLEEVRQTLCLIATINIVFSKKIQEELQDKPTFFMLLAEFNRFEKTPMTFPVKFQSILSSAKEINAKQETFNNEKMRLLHFILSSQMSTKEKIEQLTSANQEFNDKISSLTGDLDKLLSKIGKELEAIAELDKTIDEFLNQMQSKVDFYSEGFPCYFAINQSSNIDFLPLAARNSLNEIRKLVIADLEILNNSNRIAVRSAQLCLREKTYDLNGLREAKLNYCKKYLVHEQNLGSVFAMLAAETFAEVQQTAVRFQNTEKSISDQFNALRSLVQKVKEQGEKIASLSEWDDLIHYKKQLEFLTDQAMLYAFKRDVGYWQVDLLEHAHDDNCKRDYDALIIRTEQLAKSHDCKLVLAKARDLFEKLVARDKAILAEKLNQRKINIEPVEDCLTEISNKIEDLNNNNNEKGKVKRLRQAALLDGIRNELTIHKNLYLQKLLGGKSEEMQLRDFCQKAKDITSQQKIDEIAMLYPHSRFIEWLRKKLKPLNDFFYTHLKHKKFYAQFFADASEKDLVRLLEKTNDQLERNQLALGA